MLLPTTSYIALLLLPSLITARHPASSNSPPASPYEAERPAHLPHPDPADHISFLNLNLLPFLHKAAEVFSETPIGTTTRTSVKAKNAPRRSNSGNQREKKRQNRKDGEGVVGVEEGRRLLQSGIQEAINVRGRGEGGREIVGGGVGRSRGGL